MKKRLPILLGTLAVAFMNPAQAESWHAELARHWAPAIFQCVTTMDEAFPQHTNPDGRFDLLTSLAFDDTPTKASDNWENADRPGEFPLHAYVYYYVVETGTHYFLTYGLYHPRDWGEVDFLLPDQPDIWQHENDLEGVTFVIRKSESSEWGELRLLATIFHTDILASSNTADIVLASGAIDDHGSCGPNAGSVRIQDEDGRACLFVEPAGHGVGCLEHALEADPSGPFQIDGEWYRFRYGEHRGIRYLCSADENYTPNFECWTGGSEDCLYQLVGIEEAHWEHRHALGDTFMFEETFDYQPPMGLDLHDLALRFSSDPDPILGGANPAWAWQDTGGAIQFPRGLFFLDPAIAFESFCDVYPDGNLAGYHEYIHNVCRVGGNEIALDPLGQAFYYQGEQLFISWTLTVADPPDTPMGNTAHAYLSTDGGRSWAADPIWEGPASDGSFGWTVENAVSEDCRLALRIPLSGGDDYNVVAVSEAFELAPGAAGIDERSDRRFDDPTLEILDNPSTTSSVRIRYRVPHDGRVVVELFDSRGRRVRRFVAKEVSAGEHTIDWDHRSSDGRFLPAGLYFVRLRTSAGDRIQKALLTR